MVNFHINRGDFLLKIRGGPWGGPWTGSMGWSIDQVNRVVQGPRSMFCIRPSNDVVYDKPPVVATPLQRPVFQNTKTSQVKSQLYLKPLVSDHLPQATVTTFRAKSLKLSYVFNLP